MIKIWLSFTIFVTKNSKVMQRGIFHFIGVWIAGITVASAQIGINTTTPNGALEVNSSTSGMVIPKVALTSTTASSPVTNPQGGSLVEGTLVYNTATAGSGATAVSPGFYYWSSTSSAWISIAAGGDTGKNWTTTGNSGTSSSSNYIGTNDNTDFVVRTNSATRFTFTSNGRLQSTDNGTLAAPTYSWAGDSNTGLWRPSSGSLSLATNGVDRFRIISNGQIGMGTTTPNGILDITSSTNGVLFPRVALTSRTATSPVVNPQGGNLTDGTWVYNTATAGSGSTAVSPGFYYASSSNWVALGGDGSKNWGLTGNSGTTTSNYIGTTDANALIFKTNGTERMRMLSGGQIGVNNTIPSSTDMLTVTANSTYPSAINGYTSGNGCGVFGSITSGTSLYGGVQGQYNGSTIAPGIVGFSNTTASGTNYLGNTVSSIYGEIGSTTNKYSFGIMGDTGYNYNGRTGGVIGDDGVAAGILGYYSNGQLSYTFYGVTGNSSGTNSGTGRSTRKSNTTMGLGVYGGVIGGWIKGDEYGSVFSGPRFSTYHLGKVITNDNYLILNGEGAKKTISYASTSLSPEISQKGKAQLINGRGNIVFPKAFTDQLDPEQEVIVTCTPMGETKGVYISKSNNQGFTVIENGQGQSNVPLQWIAMGTRKTTAPLSNEVTEAGFEQHLDQVMHDENQDGGEAIWTENGEVKFGAKAPLSTSKINRKESDRPAKKIPTNPAGN